MKDYEKIGDHTIKKFELVSEYAKGWAHKILGYSESAGLIYIDCMCNCGKYYDRKVVPKLIIYGTISEVMWMVLNHGKGVAYKAFISPTDLYLWSYVKI